MNASQMRAAITAAPPTSQPATRRTLTPWTPPAPAGPYKLPRDVQDRLTAALRDFRNRDAAVALAAFLGRFWSAPSRLVKAFPIDRRALTDHPDLGLTEARVRGAITTLELVGFLERAAPPAGSSYQRTADGLHRRPILYRFGGEHMHAFQMANARSRTAQNARLGSRRSLSPSEAQQTSGSPIESRTKSPKNKAIANLPEGEILMGDQRTPTETDPNLEAALNRLLEGVFGGAGSRPTGAPQHQGASPQHGNGRQRP